MSDDEGVSEAAGVIDRAQNRNTAGLDEHPQLRRYIECFLETFIFQGRIDPCLRELTILRIAWLTGQDYEWAQHYRRGRADGLTDAEVLAIRAPVVEDGVSPAARVAARAADEAVALGWITPETYAACAEMFGDAGDQLQEFVHLVAGYRMMSTILNTTRPQLADGVMRWAPDGRGPEGVGPDAP